MEKGLVACIPNFSEGRDQKIIKAIKMAIGSVPQVKILHTDIGYSVNRTVITFVGPPKQMVLAAFQGICKALELIDMTQHKGTHPRMGAVDVCPLVPLEGVTMEETIELAEKLAEMVGSLCHIPVFRYEKNALLPFRMKLSQIRKGEYEGWFQKIKNPSWKPDFGPSEVSKNGGVLAIGARNIMIAYNVNLKSSNVELATQISKEIRESGFTYKNRLGENITKPGLCNGVRAIGWFIPEFNCTQVSMNLMDLNETSLWKAFITCKQLAHKYGLEVSGSEIVGMVPLAEILAAGNYFLGNQQDDNSQKEIVSAAIAGLGLSDKINFVPEEKIIEWRYNALAI
jgi:glutamate formiminotransferase/formiminotetrahydrofolate cyclodeaminase